MDLGDVASGKAKCPWFSVSVSALVFVWMQTLGFVCSQRTNVYRKVGASCLVTVANHVAKTPKDRKIGLGLTV